MASDHDSNSRIGALKAVCRGNDADDMKYYREAGGDVAQRDERGRTALIRACEAGAFEAAEILVAHGADVNAGDAENVTPLICACDTGRMDLVSLLIAHGASLDAATDHGKTPLMFACEGLHIEVTKLLLEKGADPNARTSTGETALMPATAKGDLYTVKLLLQSGADLNATDEAGRTPLMKACAKGYVDVVKLLVEKGADPAATDEAGRTAADWAAGRSRRQILRIISKVDHESSWKWIPFDARIKRISLVRNYGYIALLCAGIAIILLTAHLWGTYFEKYRAEWDAGQPRREARIKMTGEGPVILLPGEKLHSRTPGPQRNPPKPAPGIDSRDRQGRTALMWAVEHGQRDLTRFLLSAGANVNVRDKEGRTPLSLAAGAGDVETVRILCKRKARTNSRDNQGLTPLMLACRNGHPGVLTVLLQHSADCHVPDNRGRTALTMSKELAGRYTRIVRILNQHGGKRAGQAPLSSRRLLRNAMLCKYCGTMRQFWESSQSSVTKKPKYVRLLGSRGTTDD